MRYATFLDIIEKTGGLTPPEAERAARAVLETLAERITGGEARDVAVFLPRELRGLLESGPEPAEGFGLDEFLRRVAEREGVDQETAEEHARAVFTALGVAVAPGELRDMVAQLPRDFTPLLRAAGIGREIAMAEPDFLSRVAALTGLDHDSARRATDAVLETLAVRISNGEVEDLKEDLPRELHPALDRGLAESTAAVPMSMDEFLRRVAEREGVTRLEAEDHTRAVFAALREAVSSKEFSDVVSQLPNDYARFLVPAG
jgi:uncharacterized protein (DUF2267 family)